MEIEDIVPFLKQAELSADTNIQQIATQLLGQIQGGQMMPEQNDPDAETADEGIVDLDKTKDQTNTNLEGQIMDTSFKELELETAMDQNKSDLNSPQAAHDTNGMRKAGSFWEYLADKHGTHNSR